MAVALVYLGLLVAAFFFLIVLPQRRRVTAHRALVSALAVDDEVMTTGGIYGTVRAIRDDEIDLEVAPGVVLAVNPGAIAQRRSADLDADVETDDPGAG
jgi:preprotein translocase subunit YajC